MVVLGRWDSGGVMMATLSSAAWMMGAGSGGRRSEQGQQRRGAPPRRRHRTSEKASASTREYSFSGTGHAVDARNVTSSNIRDHALLTEGAPGCWRRRPHRPPVPRERTLRVVDGEQLLRRHMLGLPPPPPASRSSSGTPTTIEDTAHPGLRRRRGPLRGIGQHRGPPRLLPRPAQQHNQGRTRARRSVTVEGSLLERVFMGLTYERRSSSRRLQLGPRVRTSQLASSSSTGFTISYKRRSRVTAVSGTTTQLGARVPA